MSAPEDTFRSVIRRSILLRISVIFLTEQFNSHFHSAETDGTRNIAIESGVREAYRAEESKRSQTTWTIPSNLARVSRPWARGKPGLVLGITESQEYHPNSATPFSPWLAVGRRLSLSPPAM